MAHQMKNLCGFSVFHSSGASSGGTPKMKNGALRDELKNSRGHGWAVPYMIFPPPPRLPMSCHLTSEASKTALVRPRNFRFSETFRDSSVLVGQRQETVGAAQLMEGPTCSPPLLQVSFCLASKAISKISLKRVLKKMHFSKKILHIVATNIFACINLSGRKKEHKD